MNIEIEFSDLIFTKELMKPDGLIEYKAIDFKKFILRVFPKKNLTINLDTNYISEFLKNRYGHDKDCFLTNGKKSNYKLENLYYYQTDTGIEGPKYHGAETPVSIIKLKNEHILWEGYHRVLKKILQNEFSISAYELDMDEKAL